MYTTRGAKPKQCKNKNVRIKSVYTKSGLYICSYMCIKLKMYHY